MQDAKAEEEEGINKTMRSLINFPSSQPSRRERELTGQHTKKIMQPMPDSG